MKTLAFLKAFISPFKRPRLKWYVGKIAIGTPYYFPRRWVKATPERACKAALDEIERVESWNRLNPDHARTIPSYETLYEEKLTYTFPVPKKIGFDFCGLGYKTKWNDTDYRFEWNPILSFVFFKWQIALRVVPIECDHYWEAWLYYNYNTTGTKQERIKQCKKEFSLTFTKYKQNQEPEKINYYDLILKEKYK